MIAGRTLAVLCAVALVAQVGWAEAANRSLERAEKRYRRAVYEETIPLLRKALRENPTRKERLRVHELIGYIHAVYGRTNAAVDAFRKVLTIDENYAFENGASPKIEPLIKTARETLPPPEERTSEPSGSGTAEVEPEDPEVDPFAVPPDQPLPSSSDPFTPPTEGVVREVPPLRVSQSRPVYKKWWFWTIIGAAAAGAGVGAYFLTSSPGGEPGSDFQFNLP